jgi:hypothetical protein
MWQYLVVNNGAVSNDVKLRTDWLNSQGKEGWELVAVMGSVYYFKKPRP